MSARMVPSDLGATVRAMTIARAGFNAYREIRLFFVETGPDVYYQPNDTGRATLVQFLGKPDASWVHRPIVLAVKREFHPGSGGGDRAVMVVAVGTPRQWHDLLGIALPAFSLDSSTD